MEQLLRLLAWVRAESGGGAESDTPPANAADVGKLRFQVIDERVGVGAVVRPDAAAIEVAPPSARARARARVSS